MRASKILPTLAILASTFLPLLADAAPAGPSDWISHRVVFKDTREDRDDSDAELEIIELPFQSDVEKSGTMLMIPGFFQNAASFDLMPEKNISVARHLMKKYGLKIYLLNVRGQGRSDRGRKINLDDFSIDDIPNAIRWVSETEKSKIIVFGHSQGGNTLQASLGGLGRCGEKGNCFKVELAAERQIFVSGVALSGANVGMTSDSKDGGKLMKMGKLGHKLRGILKIFDKIGLPEIAKSKLFSGFSHMAAWEFLYHRENVSREAELALYQRTLGTTWTRVILQYAEGIRLKGLRSIVPKGEGETYASGLKNILVPTVSTTYELDTMAEPEASYRDDHLLLGSTQKNFFKIAGQGHEDFMMVEAFHADWDPATEWLLSVIR